MNILTLQKHLSSPLVLSGVHVPQSLVFCVVFYRSLFVLFFFRHCIVCSSVFWPLYCLFFCLLAIVLSVLRFTAFDYLFGIFKLFLKYKKQINMDDDNNKHDVITISHMKLWSRAAVKCLQ